MSTVANEQDHKWLTTQTREAIEEFGLMLEAREFARTKKRARIAFKLAAHTWAVLLGRAPFPTDAREVARIMDALDILDKENPRIARTLREYAKERAMIADSALHKPPDEEGGAARAG